MKRKIENKIKDKTKMEKGKIILWSIIIAIVIVLIFSNLGFRITRSEAGRGGATGSGNYNNYASLPEKCRPPAGQDIESWKEHLSHHAETQECLNYF